MVVQPEHVELLQRLRAAFDSIYSETQDYHGAHATSSQDAERTIKAVRDEMMLGPSLPHFRANVRLYAAM